jgi:glucosamine--fructose-6-phosphate aminotransferase (isomerizing)
MTALPISHMAREVAEIPEAVARFLIVSALRSRARPQGDAGGAIPALITTVARGSSDHAATYLKYAVELAGRGSGGLGRAVHRLDLPPSAAVEGRGLHRHLAIRPKPRHRRDDARAGQGGALTVAITNHRRQPDGAGLGPLPAACRRASRKASPPPRPLSPRSGGLALLAEWQQDADLAQGCRCLARRLGKGGGAGLVAAFGAAVAGAVALCAGPRPGLCHRQRGGAEVEGNLRAACRGLFGGRGAARARAIVQAQFPVLALGVEDAALPQLLATAERLAAQGADVFVTGAEVKGRSRLPIGAQPASAVRAAWCLRSTFYAFVEGLARRAALTPTSRRICAR